MVIILNKQVIAVVEEREEDVSGRNHQLIYFFKQHASRFILIFMKILKNILRKTNKIL
jgi:hypothetical protein